MGPETLFPDDADAASLGWLSQEQGPSSKKAPILSNTQPDPAINPSV